MRRRGFATIFALTVLALVAAALAAIAIAMRMEQQRTQSARIQAEQRQLLLAGATDVALRARDWPQAVNANEWSVEVPDTNCKLIARVIPSRSDSLKVAVIATVEGHPAQQTLQLHRNNAGWSVQAARLGEK